ncbi:glycosyltransferase [Streptomyces sp. CBMA123]|uniref:glycosyltransferase n=1 Tax=Streptomyces sp. CBMA123 TaxID=1896313 RepID=UPI001661C556|nr:glycosyltransferase [Streptomyces sp. CBMA123]MBD0689429.1 glycosyl hydrolase [Streptomyces sp. CBMA123]
MPHALLVSGSLGQGHDVMAQACADTLRERGWTTGTVDAMALLGQRSGAAGEAVFRRLLDLPGVYDAFHFAALRPGARLALLADAAARSRLVPALGELVRAQRPQLVVSVFATATSAVNRLPRRDFRHFVFCTDVTPHRLWVQEGTDLFLVTSEVAACAVRRYRPDASVCVLPAPLRRPFYRPPARAAARAEFGVPPDAGCVLLMSGSWGLGPIAHTAASLAAAGPHVLAVAGRNQELERRLRAAARHQPRLHAFGYTDRIPALMAAADLVVTSSGDTCSEARAIGRRLLLLDVVQGHGRDNLQHELELGHADVATARPAEVVRNALAALGRPAPEPSPGATPEAWQKGFGAALERVGLG